MRCLQLNLAADPNFSDPGELIGRYHTLTGWADALARAGAAVHVVQRFRSDAALVRNGVGYTFVSDGPLGTSHPWRVFARIVQAVARFAPDVVHINGLTFPGTAQAVRASLPSAAIVLQDHSGAMPRRGVWPVSLMRRRRWATAFHAVDAVSFTARALADRWRALGLPADTMILEIPEASTDFESIDRDVARQRTGISGAPVILWVGRLNPNKDPITMLEGYERALETLPAARLWMVTPFGELERGVRHRIAASPQLRTTTTIIGPATREAMPAYLSAADVFVSASHHEGSGYALIEAMACGAIPCVTDIASFQTLTNGCGELWRAGDAAACGAALVRASAGATREARAAVRATFERELSWGAIGRQTHDQYARLLAVRPGARA